jgi:hypothetical protein
LDLEELPTSKLLALFAGVMRELRTRGVVRTKNNPVADIAEWLAAKCLDLTLVGNSAKGHDAEAKDGTRYQVKSRRLTPDNPSTQLGVLRHLDQKHFEYVLAFYFDEDFGITRVLRIGHDCVCRHAVWSKAQSGHILHAKKAVLSDPSCEDLTELFRGVSLPGGN